jgi:1-acyl-sn-glycerol-3-phosphate acyltransferase
MGTPAISKPVLGFFRRIVRGYFRRSFHGVRVTGAHHFVTAGNSGVPLILYANHGSWWDPMVSIFLADRLMSHRQHFAPMDAAALERYGILKRVGIFPVEMKSARGAVQFLRTGETILRGGGILWVTPQGQFVDSRVRPLQFKPGLAALACRTAASAGSCTVLPLAIEYPFWDERLPECVLCFGDAVHVTAGDDADAVQAKLIAALERTMDELKLQAMQRSPTNFETLGHGTAGTGGFYALGQRLKAFILRRPYRAEHTSITNQTAGQTGKSDA